MVLKLSEKPLFNGVKVDKKFRKLNKLKRLKPRDTRDRSHTPEARKAERVEGARQRALVKDARRQEVPLLQEGELNDIINWFRKEPVIFIEEILGIHLWSKQKEIAEAVRDYPRVAVRSCSAGGKTTVAACIVLWFLAAFKPATVLTTGRSFRQVKEQLWREIRAKYGQSKIQFGGNITQVGLTLDDDWFALGFSTDEPERITGFHNRHVLVIIDEGSGVPDEVYGAIENPLAAGFTRLLLLGNPTQAVGKFRDAFASETCKGIHISAFDTPAFIGEEDFPMLISKDYVEQKGKEWGEDSPLYEVYIKGDFPSGETDRLIPFTYAEMAIDRMIYPEDDAPIAIGVDTARFGDDENVLYVRKGNKVIDSHFWKKLDTEGSIGNIIHEIRKYDNPTVNIDEGYNPGIVDGLKAQGCKVNGISFQGRAKLATFANIRAEMYWHLSEKFKLGEIQIPNDKKLLKQLTDIKKRPLNRNDQIIIESKEDMKARGLKSPDRADALALCFMQPVARTPEIRWL